MDIRNDVKCFCLSMALWIVALVACGYAESFPDRPVVGEMDDIVVMGTECVRGVNERCQAVQYATNSVSYLDQNTMGAMAATNRSLVPYYVDTNTVFDGTTNIAMLTVPGLWARLKIGDYNDQFTCMPAIGTNVATYGDCPWRIYVTNLQERCKVVGAQEKTKKDCNFVGYETWFGQGTGTTFAAAYANAESRYAYLEGSESASPTLIQHCKVTWLSNLVVQGGCGETNETGVSTDLEWIEQDHVVPYKYDVVVSAPEGKNKLMVESYITPISYVTNVIVTGDATVPGFVKGLYTEGDPGAAERAWYNSYGVQLSELGGYDIYYESNGPNVWTCGTLEGDYTPTMGAATGTPHAVANIYATFTNAVTPVDYSGTYYPNGNYYEGGGGYIFPTNGGYAIYSSLELDTGAAYYFGGSLEGDYTAVNFHGTSVVSSEAYSGPDCVGTYTGEDPEWEVAGWYCVGYEGVFYLTSQTNRPPAQGWIGGGTVEGTYVPLGTGIYGSVTAALEQHIVGDDETDTYPVYHEVTIDGEAGSVSNFYMCWLRKVVATNVVITDTNVEHKADCWFHANAPDYGDHNYFANQGLTELGSNVWGRVDEGDWSYDATNTAFTWDGVVSTAPGNTTAPTEPNTSHCTGFVVDDKTGIIDWKFLYCTNKY